MSWIATAIIGGALIGGISSNRASGQAAGAANNATNAQQQMFNTTNAQQAPWRQAGMNALNQLFPRNNPSASNIPLNTPFGRLPISKPDNKVGPPGMARPSSRFGPLGTDTPDVTDPNGTDPSTMPSDNVGGMGDTLDNQFQTRPFEFNPNDWTQYLNPAYSWARDQGIGAIQNSAAGQSGMVSGNALKAISDYTTNSALNQAYLPAMQMAFGNAASTYNMNQANTSNIFNRLSTIAGMGSASANTSAGVGAQTGANIGNSMMNAGNANAAGTIGVGNALTNGLSNLWGWSMLPGGAGGGPNAAGGLNLGGG